jgi:putative ABC transport system permease protein
MTTLTEHQTPTSGMPRPPQDPERSGSRLARWRASWRVAMRMARRDLRRHKGRSALVFAMVSLPVTLIVAVACFGATEQASPVDLIPAAMGSGQAVISGPQPGPVEQAPDAQGYDSTGENAAPIPGYVQGHDNSAAFSALTHGTAVLTGVTESRYVEGERRIRVEALVLADLTRQWGDKAHLTSGRWPTSAAELAVTPSGVAKGMPTSGAITLSADGTAHRVTVVGTATALTKDGGQPDYVVTAPLPGATSSDGWGFGDQYILLRDTPVTWHEVQQLNRYGLLVQSASVLRDPPPPSELPQAVRDSIGFANDTAAQVVAVGAVMLFILTTLLVGPAFAVSATRARRTLALAASNGAETRQLRRTVLAQAVVLGIVSALGGCLIGGVGSYLAIRAWAAAHPSWPTGHLPFDIPWNAVAILVPCAVLSAVVAALLPSLRLGRLDIVGVMRGQNVSPRLNRILPVVGIVVAVAGGLALVATTRGHGREIGIAVAAIALVLGTLMVVPALLVLGGRVAAPLPLPARMATRDAARHRSRATPTVAAILAAVSALTAFSIGLASDTQQRMNSYQPQALSGEGFIGTYDAESRSAAESTVKAHAPGLVATPLLIVEPEQLAQGPGAPAAADDMPFVAALPRGCTLAVLTDFSNPLQARCAALTSLPYANARIAALPAAEIARRLHLDPADAAVVARGGIAVAVPDLSGSSSLTFVKGVFHSDAQKGDVSGVVQQGSDQLPVVAAPASRRTDGAMPGQAAALVTPETARRLGWPLTQEQLLLRDPNGAISQQTEQGLDERIGDTGDFYVERGFQRDDKVVMEIMFGAAALLILIVTLISTALSLAEQQADIGTFAAVGATRRTRRALAAAQAVLVGLLGSALGVAVGLAPGLAVTYPLTAEAWDPLTGAARAVPPTVVIPWTPLLAVVVGVPLLAGLLSAAAIRRAPTVTRRAD